MMHEEKQLLKDLGTAAEETVERLWEAEENLFGAAQKSTSAFPWIAGLNNKLQTYAEQHFSAALRFASELSQAKEFDDFGRLQIEFMQAEIKSLGEQAVDFTQEFFKSAANATQASLDVQSWSRDRPRNYV